MDIQHITAKQIYSVEVHDQNEYMRTLYPQPYQTIWNEYDANAASLYFYMSRLCDVFFHQTFFFDHFGFYPSVFKIPIMSVDVVLLMVEFH